MFPIQLLQNTWATIASIAAYPFSVKLNGTQLLNGIHITIFRGRGFLE
jgi:hypothetical protein